MIETLVLDLAGNIESSLDLSDGQSGNEMYEQLRTKLAGGAVPVPPSVVGAEPHLFGVAMDLAARCKIWFSDEFDVDAVIQEISQRDRGEVNGAEY